jgi:hypothetical protein
LAYVDAVIQEREETIPKRKRLTSEDIAIIKLAVFIFALQEFFREGSRAAIQAVDEFEVLGVRGFTVVRACFKAGM